MAVSCSGLGYIRNCGCVGSLRENTSFLTFYSSLLGLLLIAEFAGAVFAYACRDQLDTYIRNLLNDVVVGYRDDPDLQVLIDTMQESWHCCGINGADDWDRNTYFSIAAKEVASPEAGGVPFSCCLNSSELSFKNFYCGHGIRLKEHAQSSIHTIYTDGCLPKLQLWLNNNVFLVGISLVIVAVIQNFEKISAISKISSCMDLLSLCIIVSFVVGVVLFALGKPQGVSVSVYFFFSFQLIIYYL
uniref:Tetraspanin n=1 Tax=Heterorhabditis bacteriophora TaxID=37862 RepID=A0A1I7XCJ5_HETBA